MPTNIENEALETLVEAGGKARRVVPHTATDRYGRALVVISADDVGLGGGSAPSGIVSGAKTVAVAGTAEPLAASATPCKKIIMTAEDSNSGKIYYGGSAVSSSVGDYIFPAQKITIEIDNVNKVFIDADTSTDGVKLTYFT